ncbi:hypothetical protein [Streptomyces sp. NBC_01190]|uniref:hypothetical protein n=1 Tax=Streptomyces sp. NBC_01190 TaxID=2903767 RepID=UPI00386B3A48|nr:hypothetical protein OG519_16590 [Streptomyces sp. NBC_01190]
MTSAPHLLNEDRPDFEHALDDALRTVLDDAMDGGSGPAPGAAARADPPLNAEQLRTLALASVDAINQAAAKEYEAYCAIRIESREAAQDAARNRANRHFGYAAMGVADRAGSGAGLAPVLAVLTPLLAGAAAVIFLIIGYALAAVSPEPAIAGPLRTAGWFFAVITAAAVVLGVVGLLLTAVRDGSGAIHDAPDSLPPEVGRARLHWRETLLSSGMLPFLDEVLDEALTRRAAPGPDVPVPPAASRIPRLGYSRPTFSSPHDPRPTAPRFSSPDYSSPDWGGPEHAPE